jgi:L-rhamnose isomerase/sugar isomerase
MIDAGLVADAQRQTGSRPAGRLRALGGMLARRGQDIENSDRRLAQTFAWRCRAGAWAPAAPASPASPGRGEPRNVFEKLRGLRRDPPADRATPTVSLHFPWDKPATRRELREAADRLGLGFDAVNSNTFQDQKGQGTDLQVRQPDAQQRKCARRRSPTTSNASSSAGAGFEALTVWVGDGANFPGQHNLRGALERYLDSMREIYAALPADWHVFIEHKLFEPAFYATVIADWGTSFACATELGPEGEVPGRPGPPCAEHQHRDDRGAPGAVRQARRLPLQRQQVRRRRPRFRLDQPVPAVPGL